MKDTMSQDDGSTRGNELYGANSPLSYESFRKQANALDQQALLAARFGPRVAKKFEGLFRERPPLDVPLQRVYIDHTPVDVHVLADDETSLLNRPWLTLVVDDDTRCILGFNISFKTPGAEEVLAALRHAILPKDELRRRFPDAMLHDWECCGIPDEVVVDNGLDLTSMAVDAACLSQGISITFSPPREPWFKAVMERVFGTLNTRLFHRMPGTTFGGNL